MKYCSIWSLKDLMKYCETGEKTAGRLKNEWVPARPMGMSSFGLKCRCVYLVWTGQADVVLWPNKQ